LVEIGPTEDVLVESFHPYTMGLKNAFLGVRDERREIISIPGVPPSLIDPPHGCRFHPRCPFADEPCSEKEPGMEEISPGHLVACHYHEAAREMRQLAKDPERWTQERRP